MSDVNADENSLTQGIVVLGFDRSNTRGVLPWLRRVCYSINFISVYSNKKEINYEIHIWPVLIARLHVFDNECMCTFGYCSSRTFTEELRNVEVTAIEYTSIFMADIYRKTK